MPFTLSHPLAVVPFRRLCPRWLNFAALVIGSMSPDFGYFVKQFDRAGFAHTWLGSLEICLPTGLAMLCIFYLLRHPICYTLPQPHRSALMPFASVWPRFSVRGILVAAVSVLIGAWTHIIWDSFTHAHGIPVNYFEFLRTPIIEIGNKSLPTYNVLQHSSTIIGGLGLILCYFLWLRRAPRAPADPAESDNWRYWLVGSILVFTLLFTLAATVWQMHDYTGDRKYHDFGLWASIYFISAFAPLTTLAALIAYSLRKTKST